MIEALTSLEAVRDVDNVVAMPNLMSGNLADLLAAAGGPAQSHELRGELAARTAFRSAVSSWPTSKRHLRRTPAVVAVTTVATMLVATTGLAAASVLPGPAGRAVDGILGSVGVNIGAPATQPGPSGAGTSTTAAAAPTALGKAGMTHVGCSVGGSAVTGSAAGSVETASCTITAPRPQRGVAAAPAAAVAPASTPASAAPTTGTRHTGGGSSSGHGPSTPPVTIPGGGTSRGGNIGGGTCKGTTGGTTPAGAGSTTASDSGSPSSDPTTTTTTDPVTTGTGCGHHGGHHGTGGGTGTTTTTTTTPS